MSQNEYSGGQGNLRRLGWLAIGLAAATCAFALRPSPTEFAPSDSGVELVFETVPFSRGKDLRLRFLNDSANQWQVESVRSDCGCLTIESYTETVESGSEVEVGVHISNMKPPTSKRGHEPREIAQRVYATVSNGDESRLLSWTLRGTLGAWPRLTPRSLTMVSDQNRRFQFGAELRLPIPPEGENALQASYKENTSLSFDLEEINVLIKPMRVEGGEQVIEIACDGRLAQSVDRGAGKLQFEMSSWQGTLPMDINFSVSQRSSFWVSPTVLLVDLHGDISTADLAVGGYGGAPPPLSVSVEPEDAVSAVYDRERQVIEVEMKNLSNHDEPVVVVVVSLDESGAPTERRIPIILANAKDTKDKRQEDTK